VKGVTQNQPPPAQGRALGGWLYLIVAQVRFAQERTVAGGWGLVPQFTQSAAHHFEIAHR
jgi:hypothetical protein